MVDASDIAAAAVRIEGHVRATPLWVSEPMSERAGTMIAVKAEHEQRTGSFKIRGATNAVHSLAESEAARGVVTASSGNHGIATAAAAASRDIDCTVYLPSGASAAKRAAIERFGAEIVTVDSPNALDAEVAARDAADRSGRTYVSPYNDARVIAGQGTIGKEIVDTGPAAGIGVIDAVVVSVGGGGLISGIATWLAHSSPSTCVVGASAVNDRAMAASVEAGEIVFPDPVATFSDGTAGNLERGAITFELCQRLVDVWIDVDEAAIARGVRHMIDDHRRLVEGSSGLALAAAVEYGRRHAGAKVVAVSCGGNVSSEKLHAMLEATRR